ncbi:MAG: hypothetical protein EZS28_026943, partial [Streblomastix strix]
VNTSDDRALNGIANWKPAAESVSLSSIEYTASLSALHLLGEVFSYSTILEFVLRLEFRCVANDTINQTRLTGIKDLACFIGKFNFTRTKLKQESLHLKLLNKSKFREQQRQGWESKAVFYKGILKELNWCALQLTSKNPTSLIIRYPDSLLITDASYWIWGGVCKIKYQEEIFVKGKWSKGWRLISSNQREFAAILYSLRRLEADQKEQQVKAIRKQTDNTTTALNLLRQAAEGPLAQMTFRILNLVESRDIQLQQIYISGRMNSTADALSRQVRSGDYSISPVKAQLIMNKFRIQAQIDVFSTRRNKVLKQYCSRLRDCKALSRDGLAISWNSLLICAHPPIPLTAKCIQMILQESVDLTILFTSDGQANFGVRRWLY